MWLKREHLFPVVVGLMDGTLTALTLAAGKLAGQGEPLDMAAALRISAGAALSGVCVFFVAEYARLRRELVDAERHLSIRIHGQLAVSNLGRRARKDAMIGAGVSCVCSFLGALFPLAPAALVPAHPWLALPAALVALTILGVCLARVVYGRPLVWAVCLVMIGLVLAWVGTKLHIV